MYNSMYIVGYKYLLFLGFCNLYLATEFYGRFEVYICLMYNKMTDFCLKSVLDIYFCSPWLQTLLVVIYFRCFWKGFDVAFVVLRE